MECWKYKLLWLLSNINEFGVDIFLNKPNQY